MKNKIALTIVALGLGLPAMTLNAQDDPRPPRGPRGDGARPVPPLVAALDANHDGVIDESELKAAPDALKALDKNGDGKLTPDELRPAGGPGPKPADANADHPRPPRDAAENTDGEPAGPGPGRRPGSPIVAALDANKDGVIDATEIANATAALKALDKNGDGKITMDEIRPPRPGGPGGGPNGARPRKPRPQPTDSAQ
jgi:hypothetical protein